MSVWYFSRSHSMKALSFDWVETVSSTRTRTSETDDLTVSQDVDKLIHVILAFAYATPEQLGVDPTVHLAPIDPMAKAGTEAAAQHYIYQCSVDAIADEVKAADGTGRRSARLAGPKFKYFKTVNSINDMRPYNISGRNTRIWTVVEVKGPDSNETVTGEHLVLKDVWLDKDRPTEAANMDNIFKEVNELVAKSKKSWGDDWKERLVAEDARFVCFDDPTKARLQHFLTDENYKSLFLTKLHAWSGITSKTMCNDALHSAPGVDIFVEETVAEKVGLNSRTAQGSLIGSGITSTQANGSVNARNLPIGATQKADAERKKRRQFAPKTQSRFVYKEVCHELDRVGTLGNFMDLIDQALDGEFTFCQRKYQTPNPCHAALRILFCAGWVHRDISSGNLLAFNDDGKWKIKLADLEFAEKLGYETKRSDPRTVRINLGTTLRY